jgi:histidinol-phosphate phosphatase family protein
MSENLPPALVLAGGLGTRLAAGVPDLDVAKSMAPVAGRPFLEWLIAALVQRGVRRIVLCMGYRHESIESRFGSGGRLGATIAYSREETPLGTAGALRLAVSRDSSTAGAYFVCNGDSLCPFDLERLAAAHAERRGEAKATLWTVPVPADDPSRYGTVVADPNGRVLRFEEKSASPPPGARVNAGVGLFERSVLEAIPDGRPVSLETEVLPALAKEGALHSISGDGPLVDIGTPESYRAAGRIVPRLVSSGRRPGRRFVLLDRDGTVIVEKNYLSDPAEVVLESGAGEALRRLAARGLGLVLLTNQSGINRGLFDTERLHAVHVALVRKLAAEGVRLDGIYVCPHRPDEGCECRKPKTALVDRAAAELGFDPASAFVVGDKASDVDVGKNAGATTILVRTGYGRVVETSGETHPDYVADDLSAAADRILEIVDSARGVGA